MTYEAELAMASGNEDSLENQIIQFVNEQIRAGEDHAGVITSRAAARFGLPLLATADIVGREFLNLRRWAERRLG